MRGCSLIGCDSISPQRRASRGNNEDRERGNRQCQHDSVVKIVAWSPRNGSYGQRNHSDRHAKDGNQISKERCSPCLRRLSQDSMKAALRLVLSAAKASIAPRFTKANSRPTTLLPDYITNDSEVGVFADDQARVDQASSWSPRRS
jgi:hypothetical protein